MKPVDDLNAFLDQRLAEEGLTPAALALVPGRGPIEGDGGARRLDADVVRDGPNGCLSLTQGRANYKAFGASQMKDLPYVRLPFPHELP